MEKKNIEGSRSNANRGLKRNWPRYKNIPLSETELRNWGEALDLDLRVVSREELPLLSEEEIPENIIINLDELMGPGTHWVAVRVPKRGSKELVEYFDPFGMAPAEEVASLGRDVLWSSMAYQSPRSVQCGYYCLFFLKERREAKTGSQRQKFWDTISTFSRNKADNEKLVRREFGG